MEPYFSGITGPQYTVSLIWRVHLPEEGQRLWPRAADREAVDISIDEVRDVVGDDNLHPTLGLRWRNGGNDRRHEPAAG